MPVEYFLLKNTAFCHYWQISFDKKMCHESQRHVMSYEPRAVIQWRPTPSELFCNPFNTDIVNIKTPFLATFVSLHRPPTRRHSAAPECDFWTALCNERRVWHSSKGVCWDTLHAWPAALCKQWNNMVTPEPCIVSSICLNFWLSSLFEWVANCSQLLLKSVWILLD